MVGEAVKSSNLLPGLTLDQMKKEPVQAIMRCLTLTQEKLAKDTLLTMAEQLSAINGPPNALLRVDESFWEGALGYILSQRTDDTK